MRAIAFFTLIGIIAILIAGCSAIPATHPAVFIPVALDDQTFTGGTSKANVEAGVNITNDKAWQHYAEHVTDIEAVSVTMSATNATGNVGTPDTAHIQYYVSDRGNLSQDELVNTQPLLATSFPARVSRIQYDSGFVPLSPEAKRIINQGIFFIYAAGSPENIDLHAARVRVNLKLRVSLL